MVLVLDGFFSWFGRKGIEKGKGRGSGYSYTVGR